MKEKKQEESKKRKEEGKVSEKKKLVVEQIINLIKNNRTLIVASIKNLPSKQFQSIRKEIRDIAKIKVAKKSSIIKSIEQFQKAELNRIKKYVNEHYALLFSELDPFELSAILNEKKSPAKAKAGQVALEDIKIEAGPTDLIPGPAISELNNLGLKIAVEKGKIAIKESKVIVKKGEKINETAAGIMAKLDIKPFSIGFEPLAAYDTKEDKLYIGIKIDKKKTIEKLKATYSKAIAFAISLTYICKETISFLIAKAASHGKALNKFLNTQKDSQ